LISPPATQIKVIITLYGGKGIALQRLRKAKVKVKIIKKSTEELRIEGLRD